jgi:hypothetical protein
MFIVAQWRRRRQGFFRRGEMSLAPGGGGIVRSRSKHEPFCRLMKMTNAPERLRNRYDAAAGLLIAGFILFLLLAGPKLHTIEIPDSAENDGYVAQADELRSGAIPRDPYHPLLYQLLSAGAGALLGDSFAGARTVSSLMAGLLLLMTYLAGRSLARPGAALFSVAVLALNHNVITAGMDAATDMCFAALAAAVFLLSLRAAERPGIAPAVALALVFALAYFTRFSAAFLLPGIAGALVAAPAPAGARGRLARIVVFAAAAAMFLVPHFALTNAAFGSPWHNENWKNLAFKLHGGGDWSYFKRMPYDGLRSVIASAPLQLVASTFRELARFFYSTLAAVGGGGTAGGIFAGSALFGVFAACFAIDRKRLVVLLHLCCYVVLSCAAFLSGPRFMLPVLPLLCLLAARFLLEGPFAGSFAIGSWRMRRAAPVAAALLAALAVSAVPHVRMYVRAQPLGELEAARRIERDYGSESTVFGTFPFMQRYVRYEYRALEGAASGEAMDLESYLRRLESAVGAAGADFVIVGEASLKGRPAGLLDTGEAAPFLEPLFRGDRVVVYRVAHKAP